MSYLHMRSIEDIVRADRAAAASEARDAQRRTEAAIELQVIAAQERWKSLNRDGRPVYAAAQRRAAALSLAARVLMGIE